MASHHHHNHHHYQQQQQQQQQQHNYPTCHCCCCSSNPSPFHPSPSPPPPQSHLHTVVDPLLVQSIATQILQSSQNHLYTQQYLEQPQKQQHRQQNQQQKQTRSLLTSLVRRIDALESSLHNLSVSPSPPPPPLSLRDLAARTIQTHFRAFLVRRSRTLRNLKDLAFIKSSFNSLKSSLSGNNTNLDPQALSQQTMDLLLKLDSVQGGDPMIRDGKRSISNWFGF